MPALSIEYPPSTELFECDVPYVICGDPDTYSVSLVNRDGDTVAGPDSATINSGENSVAGSIGVPSGTSEGLRLQVCTSDDQCTSTDVFVDCSVSLTVTKEATRQPQVRVTIAVDCVNTGSGPEE
jgi:hypothetical protein